MKKISLVSAASFLFLGVSSFVAVMLREVLTHQLLALVLGALILVFSGVLAIFGKDRVALNATCFFISSVAMGVLIRAWYINRGFDNSIGLMLLISLLAVAYLWVFFALSRLPFIHGSRGAYVAFCIIYAVLSGVGYFIVMINTDTTYVSTFGYYMMIELAFIFAMSLKVNNGRELLRNLTLSTYSVFAVAVIVAVFVIIAALSDGGCDCDGCDCCDGIDCADFSDGNEKKNKKKGDLP